MPYRGTVFNVLIASPSDVKPERIIAREIIEKWNAANAVASKVVLVPIGWDRNCWPVLSGRPQKIVNEQIIKYSDLAICIFHTHLGTPTGNYVSGTAEEIALLLQAGKDVMVYWSKMPLPPDKRSTQYDALCNFMRTLMSQGLVETFDNHEELKEKLASHLTMLMNSEKYRAVVEAEPKSVLPDGDFHEALSEAAKYVLSWAIKDEKAMITCAHPYGVICGNTYMGKGTDDTAADREKWFAAVQELGDKGYLRYGEYPDTYYVNNKGFETAAKLGLEAR